MNANQYKYYSLRRPVAPGTYPTGLHIVDVLNYPTRLWVEKGRYEAWGEFVTDQALSDDQVRQYELAPAYTNPDIQNTLDKILTVVGEYETAHRVPESKRCTWYCSDIGFVWDQWVSYTQLMERYHIAMVKKAASAAQ